MLVHLRLTVPETLSERVRTFLADNDGVTNLTVQPGASLKPAGDLIEADVAREAAGPVLDELDAMGLDEVGGIVLTQPIGTPFAAAKTVEHQAVGDPDDAVIWRLVRIGAIASSHVTVSYLVLLVIATSLAAIAVLTDSSVLVVGAMVVGPEFAVVSAICVGLVLRDWRLAAQAAWMLLWTFAVAIAAITVLSLIGYHLGFFTEEMVTRPRPQTGFIWRPDKWSFIVALWAGAAGVLAIATEKANAMVGVFISVTTVPAAGNIALGLAVWDRAEIVGSTAQLALNIAGMLLAGTFTLIAQRFLWRRLSAERRRHISTHHSASGWGIAIPTWVSSRLR